MKARALIEGASFGPDVLKVIAQAFDEAWKAGAGNFGEEPAVVEEAQVRLAKALLSVAADDSRDPEVLVQGFFKWGRRLHGPHLMETGVSAYEGYRRPRSGA